MKNLRTNHSGFSLIELVIIIAVMAVLTACLAPTYLRYVDKSKQVVDEANEQYAFDLASVMLATGDLVNGKAITEYTKNEPAYYSVDGILTDSRALIGPYGKTAKYVDKILAVYYEDAQIQVKWLGESDGGGNHGNSGNPGGSSSGSSGGGSHSTGGDAGNDTEGPTVYIYPAKDDLSDGKYFILAVYGIYRFEGNYYQFIGNTNQKIDKDNYDYYIPSSENNQYWKVIEK